MPDSYTSESYQGWDPFELLPHTPPENEWTQTDPFILLPPEPRPRREPTKQDIFSRSRGAYDDDGRWMTGAPLANNDLVYNSYAGTDIVAQVILPGEAPVTLGELQTVSYSIHRENAPVRTLGHVSPVGFVKGSRTIAGSMIFTVFNNYAFYRLEQFKTAITKGLYPVADMLPPLDLVLTFSNESGVFSKMKIYGITFVDEGGTMSIDDLISEQTYSYMARGIQPLTGYRLPNSNVGTMVAPVPERP